MKRAALYVRVSTQEQKKHGLSVDSQIEALESYCDENGYYKVKIYNDAGISARKRYTMRPALLQLLNDCEEGLIDIIFFTKLDRWFRSVGDYYEVQKVLDKNRIPWRAIWEDYETETSSGVFKVNIMLSVAQSEADRTSERIKSVFEYKRSMGQHLGTPPTGYIRKDGLLYKDPEKEDMINLIFETYLNTHSSIKVQKELIAQGYTVSQSSLKHILAHTAYYGDANGSKCEPYITKEQYNIIQEAKKKSTRTPKDKNRSYIFSGLVTCSECGNRMHARYSNHNGVLYNAYSCPGIESLRKHKGISMSEKKIERYLLNNIDNLLMEHHAEIKKSKSKERKKSDIARKESLENKLDRIGIRFELGDISLEEYKKKRRETMDEIASLRIEEPKEPVALPDDWYEIYQELDVEHKKAFWYSIIDRIYIYRIGTREPRVTFLK